MSPEAYSQGDRILYALSCKHQVTWAEFKRMCSITAWQDSNKLAAKYSPHTPIKPYNLLRLLESLGHCDSSFSSQSQNIYVAPSVLVRLPLAGAPQAVIAGSRACSIYNEASIISDQYFGITVAQHACQQQSNISPSRILVQSSSPEEMAEFAAQLGVYYTNVPAAWSILNFAGSIQQYRDSLSWSSPEILNWPCRIFNRDYGQFRREIDDGKCVLVNYTSPVTYMPVHFYRNNEQQAEVDRDWGRYLLLHDESVSVLFYDERKCIMAVPVNYPLPKLYARILTLCSGEPPAFNPLIKIGLNGYYYRYVPKQIADLVSKKLAQPLNMVAFGQEYLEHNNAESHTKF